MTERSVNPYRELFADMTPTEFECYCMETLRVYAEKDNLSDFTILHNQKLSAEDGTYQIDILCRFTVAGMTFKILVECKKYKHPVERKVVVELYTKMQSLGAQKGLVITTCGFQSGAVQFAEKHGIALAQMMNSYIQYIQNSLYEPPPDRMRLEYELRQRLPKYVVMLWDYELDFPVEKIYPTRAMIEEARQSVLKSFLDPNIDK